MNRTLQRPWRILAVSGTELCRGIHWQVSKTTFCIHFLLIKGGILLISDLGTPPRPLLKLRLPPEVKTQENIYVRHMSAKHLTMKVGIRFFHRIGFPNQTQKLLKIFLQCLVWKIYLMKKTCIPTSIERWFADICRTEVSREMPHKDQLIHWLYKSPEECKLKT